MVQATVSKVRADKASSNAQLAASLFVEEEHFAGLPEWKRNLAIKNYRERLRRDEESARRTEDEEHHRSSIPQWRLDILARIAEVE